MEFFLIYIALSSMLSTAHAVVKTAVGPLDYNLASQFPNMNLDGVLASLFTGVTQDKDGNFLASIGNELTSRFAPGSKIASLVAGLGASTANGIQATLAQLSPSGLATDTAGNIYVLEESRHCVRRIGVNGLINTFAGTCGTSGAAVDNVVATSSLLRSPSGVFYHTPTNRLYIADTSNHRIRMVNVATNIITTVMGSAAGSGIAQTFPATSSILTFPDDVWVSSSGVIFVADRGNNRIVRLPPSSTSAAVYAGVRGSAATAYPSGIAATSAGIGTVLVVTGDTSGNIYFGESTGMLYRCTTSNIVFSYAVSSSGGIIHDTPLSNFNYFSINQMIVSSDGRLTFSAAARAGGGVIAQVPVAFTASSPVSVIAGYASRSTNAIPATSVTFRSVNAVWGDTSGAIYVVDATSGVIVKSTAGIVSSVAGTRTVGSMSLIGNTAVAITSRLATMQSIVGDRADNIYFSAQFGVYRVSSTGILSMVAGTDVGTGCNTNWMYTGPGTSVNLCITRALALSSSGVLYISDDAFVIRRLVLSTGILSAIVGRGVMAMATSPVGTVSFTSGLWLDEPRSLLYATDALQVVRRINLTDSNPNRTVTVYAGQLGVSVSTGDNLPATSTTFNNPRGICGSSNGDIYVTLTGPLYIRAVFASTQVAQNFVGTGVAGEGDENTNPLSTPLFTSMSCFVDESRGTLYYGQYSQTGANYGSVRSASQLPIAPSPSPTLLPSAIPTLVPSVEPTESPTAEPSVATASPSEPPTMTLSVVPSALPSLTPSVIPTASPSESHTATPSAVPSATPSVVPTATPSAVPSATPSVVPTATPSVVPTASPSVVPTATPSETPTATPSVVPTATPSVVPTATPSVVPTATPSVVPTATPSVVPTASPSVVPTATPSVVPSATPSVVPTASPSVVPTATPSVAPTASPSVVPTATPSVVPTASPSEIPTASPSVVPTATPSLTPSVVPTATPSVTPTATPSVIPTASPSETPTATPSVVPTATPSLTPSVVPTASPSETPTVTPSVVPTATPSVVPTATPSVVPTATPSVVPTATPSVVPTATPSVDPTATPSAVPTSSPSVVPTATPSVVPTASPSEIPTASPSVVPTATPSLTPSVVPTATPSVTPTATPSVIPTASPSETPTATPSVVPTATPSLTPSEVPTASPSETPTAAPSVVPTASPSVVPTASPSEIPTATPSVVPTASPSETPTATPSVVPTVSPSEIPTASPSVVPTATPSLTPSVVPTATPSVVPTATPSFSPSVFPTVSPTLPPTSAVSSRSPSVNPSFAPSTRLLTSGSPTRRPSLVPSRLPTWQPSVILCKGDNGKGNGKGKGCSEESSDTSSSNSSENR